MIRQRRFKNEREKHLQNPAKYYQIINLQTENCLIAFPQPVISGRKACFIIPKIVLTNRTNWGIDLITADSLRQRPFCPFIINH